MGNLFSKRKGKNNKIAIDLEELPPEKDKFEDLLNQENSKNYQERRIGSVEDLTFQMERSLEVVEGFTPGAIKNIITISREFLRVYAVTESKINFLSCSEIPQTALNFIFSRDFKEAKFITYRIQESTQTLEVLLDLNKRFFILNLSKITGKIINFTETQLTNLKIDKKAILPSQANPAPKNSTIDAYLTSFAADTRTGSVNSASFFRVRRCIKGRKWVDLTEQLRRRVSKQTDRYRQEILSLDFLPESFRRYFIYSGSLSAQALSSNLQETALVLYRSRSLLHFYLLNFRRRKIIFSRSISVLDLLRDVNSFLSNKIGGVSKICSKLGGGNPFKIRNVIYDPKSDSLVLEIKSGAKKMILKLGNFLGSRGFKKYFKWFISEAGGSLVPGVFKDDKILLLKPGDQSRPRTVRWLDLKHLSHSKWSRFRDCLAFKKI